MAGKGREPYHERDAQIRLLIKEGLSISGIAKKLDVNYPSVRAAIIRLGLTPKKSGHRPPRSGVPGVYWYGRTSQWIAERPSSNRSRSYHKTLDEAIKARIRYLDEDTPA